MVGFVSIWKIPDDNLGLALILRTGTRALPLEESLYENIFFRQACCVSKAGRFHIDRITRGYRHHRDTRRHVVAGPGARPAKSRCHEMYFEPEASWNSHPDVRR